VDLDVFHPVARSRESTPDSPIRILYTGRIHPEKGLHLLVEAWQRLLGRGRNFELRLVGPAGQGHGGGGPDYVRRLQDLAKGAALELPGGVADPTALANELREADLYCYPSIAARGEASPVAPLEAMACGLPPVVADLPQYSAYIQDGQTGLVFTRGDGEIDSLTGALERLSDDPELRQRLSTAAITAASRYGIEEIADAYLADFQKSVDELRKGRHRP
jgi:glycosyltransferase involved in cell wall biosynthesis